MNKDIFLKLGLLVLSMSLVSCGQKTNLKGEDNSYKSSTSQFADNSESNVKESMKITYPSVKNVVESKEEYDELQKDIEEDIQEDIQEDIKSDIQKELTEKEYYDLIKEAWQKQKDYIDSIDDPAIKQSVQTTNSAAILKSSELLLEYPEDYKNINESLKKVLDGE